MQFCYEEYKKKRDLIYNNNRISKYRISNIAKMAELEKEKKNIVQKTDKFGECKTCKNIFGYYSKYKRPYSAKITKSKKNIIDLEPFIPKVDEVDEFDKVNEFDKVDEFAECKICTGMFVCQKLNVCNFCNNFICNNCNNKHYNVKELRGSVITKAMTQCPFCRNTQSSLRISKKLEKLLEISQVVGICQSCGQYDEIKIECGNVLPKKYLCDLCSLKNVSYKKCPFCHTKTQKNGGCEHMTCIVCEYEWCWICNLMYDNCKCNKNYDYYFGGDLYKSSFYDKIEKEYHNKLNKKNPKIVL